MGNQNDEYASQLHEKCPVKKIYQVCKEETNTGQIFKNIWKM